MIREYLKLEAHGTNLVGNDHDGHDEGKGQLLQLNVASMDTIGCQSGEIGDQQRRGRCDHKAVQYAPGGILMEASVQAFFRFVTN